MTFANPDRYAGRRWQILYGAATAPTGPERTAVVELQRAVQTALPYVVEVIPEDGPVDAAAHQILIGTAASSRRIAELLRDQRLSPPPGAQGFSLQVDPAAPDAPRRVAIAGAEPVGCLYGAVEFALRVVQAVQPDYPRLRREAFDRMPALAIAESAAVPTRGLWTWGYAIYDFRRYLDAMVKLRLNQLVVWNDVLPVNFSDFCLAAAARGIEIVPAGPWGWGLVGISLASAADRRTIARAVLEQFDRDYRDIPLTSLYFQTLTEHNDRMIEGASVASWACALVNEIAPQILQRRPQLQLQFGIHASSIGERYIDLKPLDPRVSLIWEDAGLVPYAYHPLLTPEATSAQGIDSMAQTVEYSKQLATFRPGAPMGLVAKGFNWIDWPGEFEHHKGFVLGERDAGWLRRRRQERQGRWDRVDQLWPQCAEAAALFYRAMLAVNPRLIVQGLVEDGMIEEGIPSSVALFGETLWNPHRGVAELLRRSWNPGYRG